MRDHSSAGLYIHFPYCVSICNYCDFDRQATGFASIPRYVDSVVAEIRQQQQRPVHSIFFGGGTPSLMTPDQVTTILTAARETFDLRPAAEITLEANPGECTVERLSGFRAAGVNRLSIGVQSLDDATLLALSRRHSADEAKSAVAAARAAGFDNLSLDFMLGLAGMTTESWLVTLDAAVALGSRALFLLHPDGGRARADGPRRRARPADPPIRRRHRRAVPGDRRAAGQVGYEQYEVSNWARPGRESRHNLTYWRDEPYLGIGAGAAGRHDGVRNKNTPSPKWYMASVAAGRADRVEEERPDLRTRPGTRWRWGCGSARGWTWMLLARGSTWTCGPFWGQSWRRCWQPAPGVARLAAARIRAEHPGDQRDPGPGWETASGCGPSRRTNGDSPEFR